MKKVLLAIAVCALVSLTSAAYAQEAQTETGAKASGKHGGHHKGGHHKADKENAAPSSK
jgi:Spy/CpxP family protein refolding chaperone